MKEFNIIAGLASILSLILSLITLSKVTYIQKNINNDSQTIKSRDVSDTTITQTRK
jgi:hypothetical protein